MTIIISIYYCFFKKNLSMSRMQTWFVFMSACLVSSFAYLLYHIADIFLRPDGHVSVTLTMRQLGIQLGFECLLVALLYYPAKNYIGWLVKNFHEEKVWRIVWIFPASWTLFAKFLIPYHNSNMYIGRMLQMYLFSIAVFFIMICALYILFYRTAYSFVEKQRIAERSSIWEMQMSHYQTLQSHMLEINRLHHDFRHHMTALNHMLKNQEYKEAERFLQEYCENLPVLSKHYCSSPAVNAMLNYYASLCRQEQISLHYNISLKKEIDILDIDFCILLGNLLENAIHECRTNPPADRKIQLKLVQTTPHIVALQVSNPYVGKVQKNGSHFLSSKHKGIGLGLKSIRMITEKYNGSMDIEYENLSFIVKILLYIASGKK